jgi:ubiquinone/menaquinone biosynthesis C-methylase UbiE
MQTAAGSGRSVVFDRAAGYYDETRDFPPGVAERVAALLARAGQLGPASEVLEIGIGTGRIALPLARHVARVTGVDLAAPMLARLRAKRGALRVDATRSDATSLPFANARFDAAVGVHVFHLIPRWREALAEIARVLRPGGILLHAADNGAGGAFGVSPRTIAARFGHENPGVPRSRFKQFPEQEGWTLIGAPHELSYTRRIRPSELIERMAKRVWSVTWPLSDAELDELVATIRKDLVARHGDLEREVEVEAGFWVRAYRRAET